MIHWNDPVILFVCFQKYDDIWSSFSTDNVYQSTLRSYYPLYFFRMYISLGRNFPYQFFPLLFHLIFVCLLEICQNIYSASIHTYHLQIYMENVFILSVLNLLFQSFQEITEGNLYTQSF